MTKILEYVRIDERNAILFNDANTQYIKEKIKEATDNPQMRQKIYSEMAKHFAVDIDKIQRAIVFYINKIKCWERKKAEVEFETNIAKLCRKVGHRFRDIKLSQLRAYRECERCGKVMTKYKIRAV